MSPSLRTIGTNIWVAESPLRFLGLELGTKMTVIKQSSGLLLHSPIKPTPSLAKQIAEIGDVASIIAPNKLHHLFAGDLHKLFPNSKLYGASGLAKKRPDLKIEAEMDMNFKPNWSDVEFHIIKGMRYVNEVVFYHKISKTLILTDIGFNLGDDKPLMTRLFGRMIGIYKKFGCPPEIKYGLVSDRQLFLKSIQRILEWDFDQIVMAHGNIVAQNGRKIFAKAFNW